MAVGCASKQLKKERIDSPKHEVADEENNKFRNNKLIFSLYVLSVKYVLGSVGYSSKKRLLLPFLLPHNDAWW